MATAAQAHQLSDYYIKLYVERYGHKPVINRNKARWSWDNILHDLTPKEIKSLLDYYFASQSTKSHNLDNFFYNYDKILSSQRDAIEYRAERQKKMDESRERARKWKEKREGRTESN